MRATNSKTLVLALNDSYETIQIISNISNSANRDQYSILVSNSFHTEYSDFISHSKVETIKLNLSSLIKDNLSNSKHAIKDLLAELNSYNFTSVVNLTYSKFSCYLTSLLELLSKKGPRYDLSCELSIRDQWSQYLFSVFETHAANPFSFSFISSKILKLNRNKNIISPKRANVISIYPSNASSLNASTVSEYIYSFLKQNTNYKIHIIKNRKNSKIVNEILNLDFIDYFSSRIIVKSHAEFNQLIDQYRFIISNDINIISLASFEQTPCIQCFNSIDELTDTNPGCEFSFMIAPKSEIKHIGQHALLELSNALLSNTPIQVLKNNEGCLTLAKYEIYSTHFQHGLPISINLAQSSMNGFTFMKALTTYLMPLCIDSTEFNVQPPTNFESSLSELQHIKTGLELTFELSEHAISSAKSIIDEINSDVPKISHVKKHSQRLSEIDVLIRSLSDKFPNLSVVLDFHLTNITNFDAENILQMAQHRLIASQHLKNSVSAYYELLETLLSRYNKRKNTTAHQDDISN